MALLADFLLNEEIKLFLKVINYLINPKETFRR